MTYFVSMFLVRILNLFGSSTLTHSRFFEEVVVFVVVIGIVLLV